ncbi:hypothetical protein KCU78_g8058, partial [Aureobasidium melanogenum]
MNTSSIYVRKAIARTTAALKTVAFEAVTLDAARRRAENAYRLKKAMLLFKKVVKVLKTEKKAKKAKNKDCHSPELEEKELDVLLQRYKALGDEYLEKKKKKLDALTDPVRVKHALFIALDTSILTM